MTPSSPVFLNPLSEQVLPRPLCFSVEYLDRSLEEDRPLLERIVAAYHHAGALAPREVRQSMRGPVWRATEDRRAQVKLLNALESKACARLHTALRSLFVSEAARAMAIGNGHAMGPGRDWAEVFQLDSEERRVYGLQWIDRLVSLAFAVGAIPLPFPERAPERYARCLEIDPEGVATAIERQLGILLEFPDVCGVFGGELRGKPFPIECFVLLAAAYQVRLLVNDRAPTILEIGGGFGGLAFWVRRMLPCRYLVYDFPLASAVQAYFLARVLPHESIILAGEEPDDAGLELRPAWEILCPPKCPLPSVVVSLGSLGEIPASLAAAYLRSLKWRLFGSHSLLSINHESPGSEPEDYTSVRDLVESVGGYRCVQRSPFFLRAGFVQEVFRVIHQGDYPGAS